MSRISKEQVKHVAELARLGLTDVEISKFQAQLSSILAYVDLLNEVETRNIEPTSQATNRVNVTRPDQTDPGSYLSQQEALVSVPDRQQGFFKTKKILQCGV